MDYEFLTLDSDKLARFVPLYVEVFNAPPWNDGWSEVVAAERLQAFAAFPSFQGMGMLVNGVPAGMILGWGERWVRGWAFHVKEMCIAPKLQRQGAGTALMQAFEEKLKASKFVSVYLQTGQATPARSFYESAGYRDLGIISLIKRF